MLAYVFVGTVCALFYLVIALASTRVFATSLLWANWIALVSAQILAYFLHSKVTFGDTAHVPQSWLRFVGVALLGLAISTATTLALQSAILSETGVLAINCVVVPTLNFLLLKLWVFVAQR